MFKLILITLALYASLGPAMERPPDLHGLSTYYGPPAFMQGDTMADGTPLDLNAPTVAVDVSLRDGWLGRDALVITECGGVHRVRVTDTGKLYEVGGWFRLGTRHDQRRWWPVDVKTELEPVLLTPVALDGTAWESEHTYQVVADFPRGYFARIACKTDSRGRGDTMITMLWLLDD